MIFPISCLENNAFIRTLVFPFMTVKRHIDKYKYRFSKDSSQIKALKGSHPNERCFIIGNGPSLSVNDLEQLKNEFCFGFNRIFDIFSYTSWRPDIYMCIDKNILSECIAEVMNFNFLTILSTVARKYYLYNKNIIFIENYVPFLIHRYKRIKKIKFSSDPSLYTYGGATVTYTAIQLASYMGFTQIYLLGIDHSYSKTIDSNGTITVDNTIKDYFGSLQTMPYTLQALETVNAAYTSALQYSKSEKFEIYNVTRGGKLEIFARRDLDTVLGAS